MIVAGFDVGQQQDPSAYVELHSYDGLDALGWAVRKVRHLPLRMAFREQAALLQPDIDRIDALAFDSGGTGQAMGEFIDASHLSHLVPVVIMGGSADPRIVKGRVVASKSRLVQSMLSMIACGELVVAPDCEGRDILLREMQAFEYQPNGKFRKMEAARGATDDAVMALAIGTLVARRMAGRVSA